MAANLTTTYASQILDLLGLSKFKGGDNAPCPPPPDKNIPAAIIIIIPSVKIFPQPRCESAYNTGPYIIRHQYDENYKWEKCLCQSLTQGNETFCVGQPSQMPSNVNTDRHCVYRGQEYIRRTVRIARRKNDPVLSRPFFANGLYRLYSTGVKFDVLLM